MNFKDIWIVEECSNPSTEYYIFPFLKITGLEDKVRVLNSVPDETVKEIDVIIFVRYITKSWINFIEKNKKRIKKIIYFMDDDLFDTSAWKGLPLRYILKLYKKAYKWKNWLLRNKNVFLVSTEYLAKKYENFEPKILPPYPIFDISILNKNIENEYITLFYHGTMSHRAEINWLYGIIKEVLSKNKNVIFEVVGDNKVFQKYRSLDNVIVVNPMKWELYKKFLLTKIRHIGLVPIFDNHFSRARSYNKFFEIVSCGAVGVYSRQSCYEKILSDGTDSILVLNNKKRWIEGILKLIEDKLFREKLYSNSLDRLNILREFAERSYKDIVRYME